MPSTVIREFHYRAGEQLLEIVFTTGRIYFYHEVPKELYEEMRRAFAKGEFFNAHIRDKYRYTREGASPPRNARNVTE